MSTKPLYSLVALLAFIAAMVVLLLFGNGQNTQIITMITVLLANVPGLVAAFMSENGKQIATKASVAADVASEAATKATKTTDKIHQAVNGNLAQMSARVEQLTSLLTEKQIPVSSPEVPHGPTV